MTHLQKLLKDRQKNGSSPVIAVAAGSGQIVQSAVQGGADFMLALNAGIYRNHGIGSLAAFMPYGNANDQTEKLIQEHYLPHIKETPIVAGVFPFDPTMDLEFRLKKLRDLGVQGITNWPAVGFVDGSLRAEFEANGFGIEGEVAMLAKAKEMGFSTFGFAVLEEKAACQFAKSGVDALILDLGLTRDFADLSQRQDKLQRAITFINQVVDNVKDQQTLPLSLAFGGPVTTAEDLEQIFSQTQINGFVGGSTFERIPVKSVVSTTVKRFRAAIVRTDSEEGEFGEIVGESQPVRDLKNLIQRVSTPDVNVCIEGESGTGKELVAKEIHLRSRRARQAIVTVNCGAIPDDLLESEFFGHEKGAYTGAISKRQGKFELADHGTLFLDEIADLSPRGQVALLRAIQQQEITPLGSNQAINVNVRIVAASNRPLAAQVEAGLFRADLYYRLNYITINVPPLRERLDDIPLLVDAILIKLRHQLDREDLVGVTTEFVDKLRQHSWPGNIRELQHVLGQAALLESNTLLTGRHFVPTSFEKQSTVPLEPSQSMSESIMSTLNHDKRERIQRALLEANGNKSKAAESLGVTRKTLYAWLQKLESSED